MLFPVNDYPHALDTSSEEQRTDGTDEFHPDSMTEAGSIAENSSTSGGASQFYYARYARCRLISSQCTPRLQLPPRLSRPPRQWDRILPSCHVRGVCPTVPTRERLNKPRPRCSVCSPAPLHMGLHHPARADWHQRLRFPSQSIRSLRMEALPCTINPWVRPIAAPAPFIRPPKRNSTLPILTSTSSTTIHRPRGVPSRRTLAKALRHRSRPRSHTSLRRSSADNQTRSVLPRQCSSRPLPTRR